jgi:outer membrane protein TolC
MKYLLTLSTTFFTFFCFGQSRTLSEFIQLTKENSATLKSYQNLALNFQLDSQILKAATSKPQVNFISNNLYAPVIKGYGYDAAFTNIANVSALVQASKNFLTKGNLAALYRAIALQNQSLHDTILLSNKDLERTVTDQFITAFADQLAMDYSKELYGTLQKEEDALKKLAQASVIKQTEFLAFTITMKQQELNYLQAQIQFNTDYLTLNYLSGVVDTTIYRLEEPKLEDNRPNDFYNSVFYQRYITDSLRIVNERKLIYYSYRPAVGAFADAGYNSTLQTTSYKNFGLSFGINIKVPIYDGHQKKLKNQKLDNEERTRLTNKNFFQNQYTQQVAQLHMQLNATEQLYPKIREQVDFTKTLILAYEKLLETGDVKVTEFVTAITNYLNAQNTFRQNFVSRLRILNQINYWNR